MDFNNNSIIITLLLPFFITMAYATNEIDYFKEEYNKKPCSIFDTTNITAGVRNPDDSITFNNITYMKDQYKIYDYIVKRHKEKIYVEPHIRGCICSHRICLRSCCPYNEMIHIGNGSCVENTNANENRSFNVSILTNGFDMVHDLFADPHYGLSYGIPCGVILLDPIEYEETDIWFLKRVYEHLF